MVLLVLPILTCIQYSSCLVTHDALLLAATVLRKNCLLVEVVLVVVASSTTVAATVNDSGFISVVYARTVYENFSFF